MATELDKLIVKIEADLSDLKKGLSSAQKQTQKSSNGIKKQLQGMGTSFANLGGRVLKFGSIFATAFGVMAVKKVVDVGMQIETLEVRLQALFGTAEEGSKAFEKMVEFAGKVPFSLEQIQQGAGSLAVVSDDADHLAKLMEITGNVASVTGLDFRSTAEQIQRSLSTGIASADLFREKGVKNMLGFGKATEISAEMSAEALEKVFGKGGKFGNATDEMAKTLGGTLSMLGDKLFSFQKTVAEAFFGELKRAFGDLNDVLDDNQESIQQFATDVGTAMADLVVAIRKHFEEIKIAVKLLGAFLLGSVLGRIVMTFNKIRLAITGVSVAIAGLLELLADEVEVTKEQIAENIRAEKLRTKYLKDEAQTIDLIKKKAKAQSILDEQDKERAERLKEAVEANKDQNDIMAEGMGMLKDSVFFLPSVQEEMEKIDAVTGKVNDIFKQAGDSIATAFADSIAKGESFRQSMLDIFQSVIAQVIQLIVQLTIIGPILESVKKAITGAQGSGAGLGGVLMAGVGGLLSGFGGIFSGKALGGNINPNMPYMVGERGPEVVVPKSAGTVIPNSQLGGGIVIEQNLNFATGVSQTVRAEVMNLLPAIKENTLSAVQDARLRGGRFAKDFGA